MRTRTRTRATVAALGLVASGLMVSVTPAAPAIAASVPTCETAVVGVKPDGKLLVRYVRNTRILKEQASTTALPFPVTYLTWMGNRQISGGHVTSYSTYVTGQRPRTIDVTDLDATSTLTVKSTGLYRAPFGVKRIADSGSYFVYGVDASGNLKRWTRYQTSGGAFYFGSAKLVAAHQGSLKTLSWATTAKIGGVNKDVLYGTTRTGALKQFQIAFRSPGRPKITVIRKTGFASYTGLSLAACGTNPAYASIVAVDRVNNKARWYTLRYSFTPKPSNLVVRPLVGSGAEWRLHAVL